MKRRNFENSPNIKKTKTFKESLREDEESEGSAGAISTTGVGHNSSGKKKNGVPKSQSKRSASKSPARSNTGSKSLLSGSKRSKSRGRTGFDVTVKLNEIFDAMAQGVRKPEVKVKDTSSTFNHLPFDHSISNIVQIKIPIENTRSRHAQDTINLIINYFTENVFSYYQYQHNPNERLNLEAHEYLYERGFKNESSSSLDINYIESMPKLLSTFETHKHQKGNNPTFFYIATKLFSMYFFNHDPTIFQGTNSTVSKSGVLITCFAPLEKKLKEYGIVYQKINKLYYNMRKQSISEDGFSSLLYITDYYQVLFFNFFLNDYENYVLDVYSSFPFNSGLFKQNKVHIDRHDMDDRTELTFTMFGCIFHKEIKVISDFLQQRVKVFYLNYTTHLNSTTNFHVLNDGLKAAIKRAEFKDNKFIVYY
jgi:hypothetical protein